MSKQARDLIERKLNRLLPPDDAKVTLTVSGLVRIVDAAIEQERGRTRTADERKADNIEAVIDAAMGKLRGFR